MGPLPGRLTPATLGHGSAAVFPQVLDDPPPLLYTRHASLSPWEASVRRGLVASIPHHRQVPSGHRQAHVQGCRAEQKPSDPKVKRQRRRRRRKGREAGLVPVTRLKASTGFRPLGCGEHQRPGCGCWDSTMRTAQAPWY